MQPTLRMIAEFNAPDVLYIRPWPDEVLDIMGFDPRSNYVETFWLGVLGPSTTWLLRRLASGLDGQPEGYAISLSETARSLGLSDRGGRSSPFVRAVARTIKFQLSVPEGPEALAVRRKVPHLAARQVSQLPPALQQDHARWQEGQLHEASGELVRRRGRLLALSMIEMGEDFESAERRLLEMRYHPALAHDGASWAWARHRVALSSAG